MAGKSGRLFTKLLTNTDGRSPAPFWRPVRDVADTRLRPGEPEVFAFHFPPTAVQLRVRVLHRRFWWEVAQSKAWPAQDVTVLDRHFEKDAAAP